MEHPLPAASASIHYPRTATGSVVKVRLITAYSIHFRTYPPGTPPGDAVQAALASCGIRQAWCQGALPVEVAGANLAR